MAKTEQLNVRLEPYIKSQAEEVLRELGISPSQAIQMFYKQVILQQGLPFEVRIPNEQTQTAIQEFEREKADRPRYQKFSDLLDDLGV